MVRSALIFSSKAKIHQLNIFVLVKEDVFELQIAVDTGVVVNVSYRADKLSKDLLNLWNG
jgi:hypothetical protein